MRYWCSTPSGSAGRGSSRSRRSAVTGILAGRAGDDETIENGLDDPPGPGSAVFDNERFGEYVRRADLEGTAPVVRRIVVETRAEQLP